MIIVLCQLAVSTGERDHYLESKRAQIDATRHEAGCLDYRFVLDADDSSKVSIIERWDSMAAFQAHLAALSPDAASGGPVDSRVVDVSIYEAHPTEVPQG